MKKKADVQVFEMSGQRGGYRVVLGVSAGRCDREVYLSFDEADALLHLLTRRAIARAERVTAHPPKSARMEAILVSLRDIAAGVLVPRTTTSFVPWALKHRLIASRSQRHAGPNFRITAAGKRFLKEHS